MWRDFRKLQNQASVSPHGTVHDMRKTYLTNLARNGVPMHVARELAGHGDIVTTASHYLAVTEDDAEKVRRVLAAG